MIVSRQSKYKNALKSQNLTHIQKGVRKAAEIILLIAFIIAAINWLKRYISTLSLIYYIEKKYKSPTPDEMKTCTEYVVKKLFRVD